MWSHAEIFSVALMIIPEYMYLCIAWMFASMYMTTVGTEQILTPVTIKTTFLPHRIYPLIRMLGYQVKPPRSLGPLLSDGQDPW